MWGARCALVLPVLAMGLVGKGFAAQPRGEPGYSENKMPLTKEERRAEKTADMEAWLRRLVGRFLIEIPTMPGENKRDGSARMVDCVNIGTGVGVHCIFYTSQPTDDGNGQTDISAQRARAEGPLRSDEVLRVSAVTEYGLDAHAGKIRMMEATERSVKRVDGELNGDTVVSRTRCWDSKAIPPCEILQSIKASDEDMDIRVHDQLLSPPVGYRYILRRMSGEEAAEAEMLIEEARDGRPRGGRSGGSRPRKGSGRPR